MNKFKLTRGLMSGILPAPKIRPATGPGLKHNPAATVPGLKLTRPATVPDLKIDPAATVPVLKLTRPATVPGRVFVKKESEYKTETL